MREFWSSPLFLAFKTFIPPWSFAIQHSDFSSFLAVSTTDKPVNRNIHALPLKKLNVFALRGFIFRDIHKNQGRSSSNSGYRIQKICGWKIYSRTRTFGAEVHKSNIRVKKLAQQVWKWWIRLKDKFCFNDLLTKSNRTEIQSYKVEERTFGTPCSRQEEEIFTDKCWNFFSKALAHVAGCNALKFFSVESLGVKL